MSFLNRPLVVFSSVVSRCCMERVTELRSLKGPDSREPQRMSPGAVDLKPAFHDSC